MTETKELQKPVFLYAYAKFEEVSKAIIDYAENHIPAVYLLRDEAVRKDPIERDSHVTVFFKTPDREPSQHLREQCLAHGPFDLWLGDAHCFEIRDKMFDDGSKHSFDVVHIQVADAAPDFKLKKLHDLFGADYKAKSEHETFEPHLTIAYVKPDTGKEVVEHLNNFKFLAKQKLHFDQIHLKEFRGKPGVKYTVSLKEVVPAAPVRKTPPLCTRHE